MRKWTWEQTQKVDSDGDGFADADEVDCVSDPADANEQCYACGWEHNDPGNISYQQVLIMEMWLPTYNCQISVMKWWTCGTFTVSTMCSI